MYPAAAFCRSHIDGAAALGDDVAMIKSIAFALVAFAVLPFACGDSGPSTPTAFCNQSFAVLCDKAFSCFPAAAQQDPSFIDTFGNSLAECKSTVLQATCAGTTCNGTFSSSLAQTCTNKLSSESCSDIEGGVTPTECDTACP